MKETCTLIIAQYKLTTAWFSLEDAAAALSVALYRAIFSIQSPVFFCIFFPESSLPLADYYLSQPAVLLRVGVPANAHEMKINEETSCYRHRISLETLHVWLIKGIKIQRGLDRRRHTHTHTHSHGAQENIKGWLHGEPLYTFILLCFLDIFIIHASFWYWKVDIWYN